MGARPATLAVPAYVTAETVAVVQAHDPAAAAQIPAHATREGGQHLGGRCSTKVMVKVLCARYTPCLLPGTFPSYFA